MNWSKKNIVYFWGLFTISILFFELSAKAQVSRPWLSKDIFKTHYFIENKGQYKQIQHQVKDVLYAVQDHDEIYFTKSGFTFHVVKMPTIKKEGNKENEEAEEKERAKSFKSRKEEWVEMKWLHANPNVEVIAEDKSQHYFTYGTADLNSYGYKKLTYKNLYNGIDVVMELHPKGGVKYTVIAASAKALQKYQFEYAATNKALKTKLMNNQLYLINQCDTLMETGLVAKDETGNAIVIQYKMANHIISFDAANAKGKIVIDPWVTNLTSITGYNIGFDVDFDKFGNLFAYGYDGCVAKYSNTGTLLWTFLGTVTSIGWSWGSFYFGNFVVDKLTGKTYTSQAFNFGGSQVVRLDANGNYDNFVSVANSSLLEIWEMKFNCSTGELIGMGGSTNSNLNFGIIDTTIGSVTTSNVTGLTGYQEDIANAVIDNNGNPYLIFADVAGGPNNSIYKVNNNYSSVIWNTLTGFNTMNESDNKTYVGFNRSNGINALAVNNQYLYFYDGYNLAAFNATNVTPVGTPTIVDVTYLPKYQGGIVTNNCNEVYVGGNNGNILRYQFNGSVFSIVDTLTIGGQAGNRVHDMMLNTSNQMLYVCGDSFVAVINPQTICADSALHLSLTTHCPNEAIVSVVSAGASTYSYTFIWKDSISGTIIRTITKPIGIIHDTLVGIHPDSIITIAVVRNSPCQIIANTVKFSLHCADKTAFICQGQSYVLSNGQVIHLTGIYPDTLNTYLGVHDSIISVQLIIRPILHKTIHANICNNRTYTLPDGQITNTAGTYIDTLINHFGCDSIVTTTIIVHSLFKDTVKASICANHFFTLPRGQMVNQSGIYNDTLSTHYGCDSIITTILKIKPISQATINATICGNQTYTLPKGTKVNTANTYKDTLSNYFGCDSIVTVHLIVNAVSYYTQHQNICSNQYFTLPNGQQVNIANSCSTIISNNAHCDSVITTILTVSPLPNLSLGNDTNLCSDNVIVLNATTTTANAQYVWNDLSTNPVKAITNSGVYSIQITASPCAPVGDSIYIHFIDCNCNMLMPNAFSPNNDTKDDDIKPFYVCDLQPLDYSYKIFNRWGQLIFATNDYYMAWDGTFNGKLQPIETYVYYISWKNASGDIHLKKGDVSLIR